MRLTVDYCTVYILYYIHGYIVLVKPDSLINICIVFEVRRWLFFSVSFSSSLSPLPRTPQ